jgi:hypothetical protein
MPDKYRLPIAPKVPTDLLNLPGKIHRGTRESYRIMGEERVHNKLILGQVKIKTSCTNVWDSMKSILKSTFDFWPNLDIF